jgi:acyl dehydratase
MVVRGVYSKAEERMMAEWREKAEKLVGWLGETPSEEVPYPVFQRVATRELILYMAYAADYWNPLWRDENYARNTRWGGIIAPPFFEQCISHGGPRFLLKMPPEDGIVKQDHSNIAERWNFFRPIRVGDSFRVWVCHPKMEDITKLEEDAVRTFKVTREVRFINQRDEVTTTCQHDVYEIIWPPGTDTGEKKEVSYTKEYVYTKEEIEAIDRIADAEEIRGAKPRYWEDVEVGDEVKPIVMGPLTTWDTVVELQGMGLGRLPMREVRRQTPDRVIIDPVTNIPHKSIEFHLTEQGGILNRSYSSTVLGVTSQHVLARTVTNWMGDDGFLKRLAWRKLANHRLGDTIFGRGRVVKKYISDNGEYLVDLDVWMESNRGYVSNLGPATVSLPSRGKDFE